MSASVPAGHVNESKCAQVSQQQEKMSVCIHVFKKKRTYYYLDHETYTCKHSHSAMPIETAIIVLFTATHTHAHTHTQARMHAREHVNTHTHTHTHKHACTHTHTQNTHTHNFTRQINPYITIPNTLHSMNKLNTNEILLQPCSG